jgi:hypothetical protein
VDTSVLEEHGVSIFQIHLTPRWGCIFFRTVVIHCDYTISQSRRPQSETESCCMCQDSLNVVNTAVEYIHFVQVHRDFTVGMLVVMKGVMDS